jgi:hypothetical protein
MPRDDVLVVDIPTAEAEIEPTDGSDMIVHDEDLLPR